MTLHCWAMAIQISIENILLTNGPLPSSKVKAYLIRAGLSDDAARQRLSRANPPIHRLTSLKLPRREGFLYLAKQYGSRDFWHALMDALAGTKSAHGIAMLSLLAHGGTIRKRSFDIICGSPYKLKKHLSSFIVLKQLMAVKFLKEIEDPVLGTCISLDANGYLPCSNIRTIRTKHHIEDIIVSALKEWVRKMGLSSYDQVKSRLDGSLPMFGQFAWDITGPSYVFPLVHKEKKVIPGFFVADAIYGEVNEDNVVYFIYKCQINRYLKNMRPFMAVLVADSFTAGAYAIGSRAGVIFATPSTIFGEEMAGSLRSLSRTLEVPTPIAAHRAKNIKKLFSSLSRIDGAKPMLQKALFKIIVGHLVNRVEGHDLKIDFTLADNEDHTVEVDVQRIHEKKQIAIYECKGGQPSAIISKPDVLEWLEKKIPLMRTILLNEQMINNTELVFEYWTTGKFSKVAIIELENAKRESKKISIGWKDGTEVLDFAEQEGSSSIAKVLRDYYEINSGA